MKSSTFELNLM